MNDERLPDMDIPVRLRLAREAAGLDQREFGDLIGVSQRSIGNYERGVHPPKRPILLSWALATKVPLAWLTADDPICGNDCCRAS